jgi:MFS family permease
LFSNISKKNNEEKRPKIFYGWWIVVVSLLGITVKIGSFNRNFTIYVVPIRQELGIGVSAIAFADMLGRLTAGIFAPLIGYFVDKLGYRNMLIFGGIASGLGFILLAFVHSYVMFCVVLVGLISFGVRAGFHTAAIPAINAWFKKHRGLAMAIISTGNGIGGAFAPLVAWMVLSLGWRRSSFVTGVFVIMFMVSTSWIVKQSPESMGLNPDGISEPLNDDNSTDNNVTDYDFTVKQAMHTLAYWQLVWAVGLRNSVTAGINFLMAPVMIWYLQGSGREETESLIIASIFMMFFSMISLFLNPLIGWVGDRWHKEKVSSLCMLLGGVSIFMLLDRSGALWQLAVFALMLAVADAANPLAWAMLGDYFGRENFATLQGWQHLPNQLMSMSTPVWMGLIFDNTGSYYWALIPCAVIYICSSLSYWTLKKPKMPLNKNLIRI